MKNNYILSSFKVLVGIIFVSTLSFSIATTASASTFKLGDSDSFKLEETSNRNEDVENETKDSIGKSKNKDLEDCHLLTPTAVPEPFTVIGTLVGGAAAFRMRNKLKVKVS